jgi:hypothetical protein
LRVIVCGSRNWLGLHKIKERLKHLPPETIIISGHCKGADMLGEWAAKDLGFTAEVYPADWRTHGYAAGPLRNQQMLDTGADLVIAFHNNIAASKGTKDMLSRAVKAGVPIELIT